jgi:hypothetical protein
MKKSTFNFITSKQYKIIKSKIAIAKTSTMYTDEKTRFNVIAKYELQLIELKKQFN